MAAQAAAAAAGGTTGAAVAAPYIAAGVSAGSGIVGAIANRRSQRRAYEYNRALMREQYQLEREQQDYQNAYNSPIEQRKRLEEAGFNPNSGIEGYQSADAAAPDPIPMQPLDYTSSMSQIANGVNSYFQIQSQQQQLRYQKLRNDEQEIRNYILGYDQATTAISDYERRTRLYSSMVEHGMPKEKAAQLAYGLYNAYGHYDSQFEDSPFTPKGYYGYVSAQEYARKAPWSSEQARLNYYRSILDYNTSNASAYGTMQRFDYLKEVNREIDKLKVPYHVKAQMKFAAQSMIQEGNLMGITPKDIIGLVGGRISRPLKTVYNSFNNSRSFNFKTDKTNIINN